MGIASFFRRKRADAFPELEAGTWEAVAARRPGLAALSGDEASRLRRLASWFLADKEFATIGGAELDPVGRATIATLACLPILRLGASWYDDWTTVLVAPDGFRHSMTTVDDAGVVTEYDDELSGRVTEMGPVLLSLADVMASGYGDGYNVVIHEMAHKLDERDGALDGRPPLPRSMSRAEWRDAFGAAYDDFKKRVDRGSRGLRSNRASRLPMDEYGAESPDEFFAVACETYFDAPRRLLAGYPLVHGLLRRFFAGAEGSEG
jgi:hypothetical protein